MFKTKTCEELKRKIHRVTVTCKNANVMQRISELLVSFVSNKWRSQLCANCQINGEADCVLIVVDDQGYHCFHLLFVINYFIQMFFKEFNEFNWY